MLPVSRYLIFAIQLAGLAQIILAFGSLAIPKVLNWKAGLSPLQPLLKQMFWTYAGYILAINLCFGLVSLFCYRQLLIGTTLSMLVCGFIVAYWLSRILVQFFYFDRSGFPKGAWYIFGETTLVLLFVFLAAVYSFVFYINLQHNII